MRVLMGVPGSRSCRRVPFGDHLILATASLMVAGAAERSTKTSDMQRADEWIYIDSDSVNIIISRHERNRRVSIEELEEQTGVSTRTIRFYISQGLLPGPRSRGRGAVYDEEHLARLKLIQRLRRERMPLTDIHDRLTGLSTSDVQGLLAEEERRHQVLEAAALNASPRDYISALLARARESRGESSTPRGIVEHFALGGVSGSEVGAMGAPARH